MKKAFTLMEVNLAIVIMSMAVLAIVVLYSMGYKEAKQSSEDMMGAAYSEIILGKLTTALSDKDLKWSQFKAIQDYPYNSKEDKAWGCYVDENTGEVKDRSECNSLASSAFNEISSHTDCNIGSLSQWIPLGKDNVTVGIVVAHEGTRDTTESDGVVSAVVKIGVRVADSPLQLLAAPLYYTEVRFQGDPQQ